MARGASDLHTPTRLACRSALLAVALAWTLVGAAADKDDDAQLAILTAGRAVLFDEHKPAQAISGHFDKVIRHYEARFRNAKDRIYCARTPEEMLVYAALDAAAGQPSKSIVLDSTWSDAYFLKGYALVELEQPAEAQKALARALELSPMNSAYLSESAHLDQMNKDWETALGKFELATQAAETTTPEEARTFEWTRALRGQGFALIELGRLEEAKSKYYKALELDPDDEGSKGELRYIERMEANLAAESAPFTENPDWVFSARVQFVEEDMVTARPQMSQGQFKLLFPWVGGNLFGNPTTNDYIEPALDPDYAFTIDLNRSRQQVIRSLDVANLSSLDLKVEPAELRIARVATFAMKPDLSDRVGYSAWRDADNATDGYVLVYFDRAGRITGVQKSGDAERTFDVDVPAAGYYWLRNRKLAENRVEMTVGSRPKNLVLAVAPLGN